MIMNGFDVSSHVQDQGVTRGTVDRVSHNRVTIGGKLYTHKIRKLVYNIKFDPMDEFSLRNLLGHIEGDTLYMSYRDPILGHIYRKFFLTIKSLDLIVEEEDGVSYWSGLEVELEEQ